LKIDADTTKIPFFKDICEAAAEQGVKVYFVGGSVRDLILGRDVTDVDIIPFGCGYEKFAFVLKKKLKAASVKFKDNVRLVKDGTEFDVSVPRGESLEEDLAKRDFTVNALALDCEGGVAGDASDIENGIVRMVYPQAFDDDPLRVLRAYRFASQLGFEIDSATRKMARSKAPLLDRIARERIFSEFRKLCEGVKGRELLRMLVSDGILRTYSPVGEDDEERLLAVLDTLSYDGFFLKVSALLFGFTLEAEAVMAALCYPAKTLRTTARIARACNALSAVEILEQENLKTFVYNYKEEFRFASDIMSASGVFAENLRELAEKAFESMNFENEHLIGGLELSELNVPKGPLMGEIIRDVSAKLACGRLSGRQAAVEYIKKEYGRRIDEAVEIPDRKG
jgi:tRNA nucleotidyltransferase/poly(A) polymerase